MMRDFKDVVLWTFLVAALFTHESWLPVSPRWEIASKEVNRALGWKKLVGEDVEVVG
jgi:uncharacterized membrane protein YbhN (UPF0104 family)